MQNNWEFEKYALCKRNKTRISGIFGTGSLFLLLPGEPSAIAKLTGIIFVPRCKLHSPHRYISNPCVCVYGYTSRVRLCVYVRGCVRVREQSFERRCARLSCGSIRWLYHCCWVHGYAHVHVAPSAPLILSPLVSSRLVPHIHIFFNVRESQSARIPSKYMLAFSFSKMPSLIKF